MSLQTKISSDVLITTLFKSSLKIRGLVLIPLLSLFIGVEEYGAYVQVVGISILITYFFIFGLDNGYVQYIHKTDSPNKLYTALLIFGIASSAVGGILIAFGSNLLAIYTLQNEAFSILFLLGGVYIPLHVLFRLVRGYFRANRRIKVYSAIEAVDVYISIGSIAFAVLVLETWIVGAFSAMILARMLIVIGTLVLIIQDGGIARPTLDGFIECFRFSIGTMGFTISQSLLDKGDRLLLGFFLGANAVGIYSAAYSIAYVILLYLRPLTASFFPEFSKLWDEDKIESVRSYSISGFRYLGILSIPSVVGLWIIGEDVLRLLSTQEIATAGAIPLVIISAGMFVRGIGEIYAQLFFATDRSEIPAIIQSMTVVLNIGLNLVLIPVLGILGAAVATLVSFTIGTIILGALFQRHVQILPKLEHFFHIGVSTVVMAVILIIFPGSVSWPLKVFLGALVFFITMAFVGGISQREVQLIINTLSRTFR